MGTVVNRKTGEILESVNTPDYPNEEWIINPAIPEVPDQYLKIDGDEVLEMTDEEKSEVDAQVAIEEQTRAEQAKQESVLDVRLELAKLDARITELEKV
jgi:hypothetical protein